VNEENHERKIVGDLHFQSFYTFWSDRLHMQRAQCELHFNRAIRSLLEFFEKYHVDDHLSRLNFEIGKRQLKLVKAIYMHYIFPN
jgi:hypothetical protein